MTPVTQIESTQPNCASRGRSASVGERASGVTDAALDALYAAGTILQTHVLRPTWHFVAPADIRWLLGLTRPRLHVGNAYMYRKLGLDEAVRARCVTLVAEALAAGNHRTRAELKAVLESTGVATDGFRLAYILMSAELDGVIYSEPLRGNQHTSRVARRRVPPLDGPDGDDAWPSWSCAISPATDPRRSTTCGGGPA
jgi:hypothetical protein